MAATDTSSSKRDLDHILEHLVGGCGLYQVLLCLSLVPTYLATGLPLLLHVFAAYTPRHRCYVDGCDDNDGQDGAGAGPFLRDFLAFSVPRDHAASSFLSDSEGYDPCLMFLSSWQADSTSSTSSSSSSLPHNTCAPEFFLNSTLVNCTRFVYDRSEFVATLTTEFDLVCDQVGKRHLIGSVMMLGLTAGSFLGGPIGDRIGRKGALLIGILMAIPCLFLGGFVPNYEAYILLKFIACTVIVFAWIATHNYHLEFFSKSYRRHSFSLNAILIHSVQLALPAIVYLNRHWTDMHVWCGLASLSALPVFFCLPESARWLTCNGRADEAEELFHSIARRNGRQLTLDDKREIHAILRSASRSRDREQAKLTFVDMFRPAYARVSLTLLFCWPMAILALYVLILNVNALAGNIFVNFVLGAVIEVPAILAIFGLSDWLGRRQSLLLSFNGLGLACLAMAFSPKEHHESAVLAVYLFGKFCAAMTTNLLWLYTAELFPTNLRSQAMGTCSMVARIFGLSASFIGDLASVWRPLPMVALGLPAITSGFLILGLPETSGQPLQEAMQGGGGDDDDKENCEDGDNQKDLKKSELLTELILDSDSEDFPDDQEEMENLLA